MARTTKVDLAAQGTAALVRSLTNLGHYAVEQSGDTGWDLTVTVDGIDVPVDIKAASVITPETVARMLATTDDRPDVLAHVVVGDLVTGPAQQVLREAGWGWLDRRGHLVLRAVGVHIDADVPEDARRTPSGAPRPISGVAAISWAVALLLSPDDPPSMRQVARQVSISHSAIVAAAKKLRAASLVRSDGRPLVPELFWTLAEEWHAGALALAELPPDGSVDAYGALGVNPGEDGPGWAVAGTVGAVAWGAPVAVGSAYPPDFYVPGANELRRATLRLSEATRFEDRACTVAVAPTPLVCTRRHRRKSVEWGQWWFAHGLFVALDLAQDQARGAEILADWQPEDFTRVW